MVAKPSYDLLLTSDHVKCTAEELDGPGVVAILDGRIVDVAVVGQQSVERIAALAGAPTQEKRDFGSAWLIPGLIDLHAHVSGDGTHVHGVDAGQDVLPWGTTTVMSQGDAGADNLDRYVEKTILKSPARLLLAINLSRAGEKRSGTFDSIEDADVEACVRGVERHAEYVWGISINVSHHACASTAPQRVLKRGLEVARQTELPILFGMRRPEDWPLAEQLALLRAGDVVTYCFRREPHCIVDLQRQRVLPEVVAARRRGILFDVGHGTASFDPEVAHLAIAEGFLPDTISTDLQQRHLGKCPRHTLPRVMEKLHAAGMSWRDVLFAVTSRPSEILRRTEEFGCLAVGSCADLVALHTPSELGTSARKVTLPDEENDLVEQVVRAGQLL